MSKNYKKVKLTGAFALLALSSSAVFAQMQNNASVYIADEGIMYIAGSNFGFGASPARTETSVNDNNYGVIAFGENATWTNASNDHFVDGYVRYYGSSAFIAPVGDNSIYAPVALLPSGTAGVDAAYFRTNPSTLGSTVSADLLAISDLEYWKIKGTPQTVISLTWRASSNISTLLSQYNISELTIAGYNGTEWVEIPSLTDATSVLGNTSTANEGSVTSLSAVNLNNYEAFTVAVKGSACLPVIASSGNIKTWDGSAWLPSEPTIEDPVIINQPYSGNLSCYSVELNANIALADGEMLDVVDGFTGSGKVIMSSEASLLQRNSLATPPVIEITKVTNPMRRFDYVFLSSPINNFSTFFQDLNSPLKAAVNGMFGQYPASAFYYLQTDSDAGNVVANASNVPIGRGVVASVRPNQGPYSTSNTAGSWYTEKYPIHIKTEGITNNGNITVPVPSATGWVRLGNPYPSPINATKLLREMGDNFLKTLYFWTYTTPRQFWQNNSSNYSSSDYAIYNLSGGVAACSGCQVPTGSIATMQSVYVRKINPSPITFTLTNCFRDLAGNDNFFRTDPERVSKYWLNLTGNEGSFSQILVAYDENRSNEYEDGFDATRMPGASLSPEVNSVIDGINKGFAIQTRSAFHIDDVVPLQVIQPTSELLSIAIDSKTGVFDTDEVVIYLKDKLLDIYHNLNYGPYSFVQAPGTENNRFEVVYMEKALSSDDFYNINTLAYTYNRVFNAQSNVNMAEIEIYDLSGRLIEKYININSHSIKEPFNHAEAVYFAKIKLENGSVVHQKLIHNYQ
jgi:hypothetical protein